MRAHQASPPETSTRTAGTDPLALAQELVYLSREEVIGLGLTSQDILVLVEQALIDHGRQRYEMPAKIGVHPHADVFYHAMPAHLPSRNAVGCKWIECYPRNPAQFGLPQTTGVLIMNDPASGCPVAIMDSTWITAMRTPAVTVLAAAALHPHARTFGMIGCGVQGREHVRFADAHLTGLEAIHVYDSRPDVAIRLVAELSGSVGVPLIVAACAEELVKSCEVISSATVILKEPLAVVKDEWVTSGQTILPCDLNTYWDPAIAHRADAYIVDSIEEHRLFADMGYFPDGLAPISAETGAVLAGLSPGRTNLDQVIVNSNIGMAVCDVAVGREVYERAVAHGAGRRLPL